MPQGRAFIPVTSLCMRSLSPAGYCVCSSDVHCPECSRITVCSITVYKCPILGSEVSKCTLVLPHPIPPCRAVGLNKPSAVKCLQESHLFVWHFTLNHLPLSLKHHFCSPTREPHPLGCPLPLSSLPPEKGFFFAVFSIFLSQSDLRGHRKVKPNAQTKIFPHQAFS